MDQGEGAKIIPVFGVFPEGAWVVDDYSGERAMVRNGAVSITTGSGLVLLGGGR
jgi:hypothetical protein